MKRDLLFAVFAVQSGLISAEKLMEIQSAWAMDQSKSILDRLKEVVPHDKFISLEQFVTVSLKNHGDDIGKTLQSIKSPEEVFKSIGGTLDLAEEDTQENVEESKPVQTREPGERGTMEMIIPQHNNKKDKNKDTSLHEIVKNSNYDRYIIKEEKDRGGIGRVLIAFDNSIGRDIAIKELLPESLGLSSDSENPSPGTPVSPRSAAIKTRFLREARITGQLEHPSIVTVHEIGERGDGTHYYSMKLIHGQTLKQAIRSSVTIEERLELLKHFYDACNAIAFAHSRNIIHRDIKTDNIMIGEFGETVVLDWGLAKVKGEEDKEAEKMQRGIEKLKQTDNSKTVEGKALGTPAYMPPEQALGEIENIDEQSDIYSLGAVLYEILTGQPPFTGKTVFDILSKVITENPEQISVIEPEAPNDLAAIAHKALYKHKNNRYTSAKQLAKDIKSYLTGEKVRAYDYSSWELFSRFIAKNKIISFILTLFFISLIAGSVIIYRKNEALEKARLFNLSQATLDKSTQLLAEKKYLSAKIFATASLTYNPIETDPSFRKKFPESVDIKAHAQTNLYLTQFAPQITLAEQTKWNEAIQSAAYSPDGKSIAVSGWKDTISIYSENNFSQPAELKGHSNIIWDIAFSRDGTMLASGSVDKSLRIWDLKTNSELRLIPGNRDTVVSVDFSPDSRLVAYASHKDAKIFQARSGTPVLTFIGHKDRIMSINFFPDGKRVLTGSFDGSIKSWNTYTGMKQISMLGHRDAVWSTAISHDGKLIASGSADKTIRLWYAPTGKLLSILNGHKDTVVSLSFSPDGKYLISGSVDKNVIIWDLKKKEKASVIEGFKDTVYALDYSPSGDTFITGSYDHSLKQWHVDKDLTIKKITRHRKNITALETSPDEKHIATIDKQGRLIILDTTSLKLKARFKLKQPLYAVAFSQDSQIIAVGGQNKNIYIFDLIKKKGIATLSGHKETIRALAFSPDGKYLTSSGDDMIIRVWDYKKKKLVRIFSGHRESVNSLAFSPDSKLLFSASSDRTVSQFSLSSGMKVNSFKLSDAALSVTHHPQEAAIFVGGKDKKVTKINYTTHEIHELSGHEQWVNKVVFDDNNGFAASCSDDQTIRIWNTRKSAPVLILPVKHPVKSISFISQGTMLAAAVKNSIFIYPLQLQIIDKEHRKTLQQVSDDAGLKLSGFKLSNKIPIEKKADK